MNKLSKKEYTNKASTQSLLNMINCIKETSDSYYKTFSERNRVNSELYSIADYRKEFDGFFNHKTLPISIENNTITFELNDEIEYIRCQLSEELAYEHLFDDFFDKQCLVKIWAETLFYTLYNSIKNSSITEKYGTSADDYDWGSFEFIETSRRSKYKESLFDKYNMNTFLDDAYLSNNRIYLNLEPKFAERLRFLVGNDSENWLKNCVQDTAIDSCREWIFSVPTEEELDGEEPIISTKKQVDNFILDNRLIVNWAPAK